MSEVTALHGAQAAAQGPGDPPPPYIYAPSLVTLSSPSSESAESVRAVRTHVLVQHIQAGRRALAVCSPNLGSGSTFLAANLAVALAQIGLQVLLIDADLREPGIDKFIVPARKPAGLVGCLTDPDAHMSDYIEADVLPNLSVLFAGGSPPGAQELLASHRFDDCLHSCLRNYDLTIIDTPPANTYSDARRIASVASYALIVARRHKSLVPDVKVLCREMTDDNVGVVGTVLND